MNPGPASNLQCATDGDVVDVAQASVGDWVLVEYDQALYPGKLLATTGQIFQVAALEKTRLGWRYPILKDEIWYPKIVKVLDQPDTTISRGKTTFCFNEQV